MYRSLRLESLFGKRIDQLTYADIVGLCGRREAAETAELDYKKLVHARSDPDKDEFRKDSIAMGNSGGGILLIGVEEDQAAAPAAVPGVDISDSEQRRLRALLHEVSPFLPVEILPLEDPSRTDDHGVLLIMVEASAMAPHALLSVKNETHHKHGWMRFPVRDGAATRWLREPEVATRYRRRFTEARNLEQRLDQVEQEAFTSFADRFPTWARQYSTSRGRDLLPVLTVALTPEQPGNLRINAEVFRDFQQGLPAERSIEGNLMLFNAAVSTGRLIGITGESNMTRSYAELHADGSGVVVHSLVPRLEEVGAWIRVSQSHCVSLLLSSLLLLGRHGRDRAGASGVASVRFRLLGDIGEPYFDVTAAAPDQDLMLRAGGLDGFDLERMAVSALGTADSFIDDLASAGAELIAAASLLADQAFHAFGLPEVTLITPAGHVVGERWPNDFATVRTWAQQEGLLSPTAETKDP